MSSLSLPRVLQQRKTSLEQEREHFEKFQSVSIAKAINNVEHPVKEKHVRSAIMGTFHERSGETFWACVVRLPLQEQRIVAWKFCHVLHKLLREGHPLSINSSQRHVSMINDLGKLWGHLKEGYGKLIECYCKLLVVKIIFHRRNPDIPGDLSLDSDQLDALGDNDINVYFQLAVEVFDYMDEILNLQTAIFGSLDMSRSNSMTSCGQCRLAPLIPALQDASQLYDLAVRLLFRLHAALPPDLLSGHRTRFLVQFKSLTAFYSSSSALQYFKNLIQIPGLPENPPNFLVQAELRSYVRPVVVLPSAPTPPLESTVQLVDLATPPPTNGTASPDISPLIPDRNSVMIEELENEVSRYRNELSKVSGDHLAVMSQLNHQITILEAQLVNKESQLAEEKALKQELLLQSISSEKHEEAEKKYKVLEEKFQKLKEIYSKLREQHIQLIRQKADVDKQLSNMKTMEMSDTSEKLRLEQLAQELAKLQATADAASEQNLALESKVEFLSREKNVVENELQDLLAMKEELDTRLNTSTQEIMDAKQQSSDLTQRILDEGIRIVERAVDEVDNPALSSASCSLDYLKCLVNGLEKGMRDFQDEGGPEQIMRLAHLTASFIIHGKATSNTAPNIQLGEQMVDCCKRLGEKCVSGLGTRDTVGMRGELEMLLALTARLGDSLRSNTESIGDLVEQELSAMDKAIQEAVAKMEELLSQSRAEHSGIELEVNEKILDSCTGLMQAILVLVQKAKIMQAEIVAQGKGTASVKEFYKRNHQWTEGLISAAKAVGMGAKYLLEAADDVVVSSGKVEMVIVAAQEICASTAQLVVASRVKAERGSKSLGELASASKDVTKATATVLASAKACTTLVDRSEELDLSKLDLHKTKRLEMESQVRVLELETLLDKERLKFSALRRKHYSLAPDSDQLNPPP